MVRTSNGLLGVWPTEGDASNILYTLGAGESSLSVASHRARLSTLWLSPRKISSKVAILNSRSLLRVSSRYFIINGDLAAKPPSSSFTWVENYCTLSEMAHVGPSLYSEQLLVAGNLNLIHCCISNLSGLINKTPAPLLSSVEDPSTNSNHGEGNYLCKGWSSGGMYVSAGGEHSTKKLARPCPRIDCLGMYVILDWLSSTAQFTNLPNKSGLWNILHMRWFVYTQILYP